jgi:hypothetical protein
MKISIGDLRQIIRETLDSEQLALHVWSNSSSVVKVVLYSPTALLLLDWSDRDELPMGIIKGYAVFRKPKEPCNDAWEVSSMAGIGHGKILYGLGYSLTPKGRLMPDRAFSSKRAKSAWTKSSGKMARFPLDDIKDPQTEDPNDDCAVQVSTKQGGPDSVLDVAYEGPPVNPRPMMRVHDATVKKLMKVLNGRGAMYADSDHAEVNEMLGRMLRSAGREYFDSEFDKHARER